MYRVITKEAYIPDKQNDRIMSTSYVDRVASQSWWMVWRFALYHGKFRSREKECCLLELDLDNTVPRLYCIPYNFHFNDQQSEIILPLNCTFRKTGERTEIWNMVKHKTKRDPLFPSTSTRYYDIQKQRVLRSDNAPPAKVQIHSFKVSYDGGE